MKKLLFFFVVYLLSVSCVEKKSKKFFYDVNSKNMTYLALGDSYTIGESVDAVESFPVQTAHILRDKKININDPDIIALTGWTTRNLLDGLNDDPPGHNYSFVTLLIGVNNQYQGENLDEYKTEFAELLARSILYAGKKPNHVFVLSIPDYSVTPFAANADTAIIVKDIDEFNKANKTISLHAGVHYIDITTVSRTAKNDPSLIAGDGLHPSGVQYKMWSDVLAAAIIKELQ